MSTVFITVVTSKPEQVQAYLYSHTTVLHRQEGVRSLTFFVLKTTGENAAYSAEYQAARLASGLHGAAVFETLAEALVSLSERFDVVVEVA